MTALTATMTPLASAKEVLNKLPESSTWNELLYHLMVREKLEEAHAEVEAGQLLDDDEVFTDLLADEDKA